MGELTDKPIRPEDVTLSHGADVSPADQLEVIGFHFRDLSDVARISSYFGGSSLGESEAWVVRWQGRPIAHLSVFPYPVWIDGKPLVVGKPEAQVLHPSVIARPRPDVMGMLWNALIEHSRNAGWPLLVALGNEAGNRAMQRRGFRDLTLPAVRVTWPLTAADWRPLAANVLSRRQTADRAKQQSWPREALTGLLARGLQVTARTLQSGPKSPITLLDADTFEQRSATADNPLCGGARISFRHHANFLRSRLDPVLGYRLLQIAGCAQGDPDGSVIVKLVERTVNFHGVLPASWLSRGRFWRSLADWSRRQGANTLKADLYSNNPGEAAAARLLRRFPLVRSRQVDVTYSLMVLDREYEFANDPQSWAATAAMGAGF